MSKELLRRRILAARDAEPDRESKGRIIQQRVVGLAEFQAAGTVLSYISVPSEVATSDLVRRAIEDGKRVAVPYVTEQGLQAAFISSLDELVPARFGLREPSPALRADATRVCEPGRVDLFIVPGVAFDRSRGRLGHGRAYYDRLLARAAKGSRFIAPAFECQIVAQVPMTPTDVFMHAVVTEKAVYRGQDG